MAYDRKLTEFAQILIEAFDLLARWVKQSKPETTLEFYNS
jgi:hypothetical protein